jgi:transcriptional regulator with XRE-family HTH domain
MLRERDRQIRNADLFDATPLRRAKLIQQLGVIEIAQRAGTSKGTVSKVLNGLRPNARTLPDICRVLGVDIADCFPQERAQV